MKSRPPLRRHLCILDVGHGNSTVIISGAQSVVAIDVGRQSTFSEFLLDQGITHIDSIYLSHADADHIGALVGILATRQATIDHVYLNSNALKDTQIWDDLVYELDCAKRAGSLEFCVGLTAGKTEELPGDVCLRVLGPSGYLAGKGVGSTHRSLGRIQTNSISAVMSVTVAGATLALLPGDLDGVGLRDLLEKCQDLRASVLVYPHHGGFSGGAMDPTEYARTLILAVKPKLVVFSIGRGQYATPNPETVRILRETVPSVRVVCTQLSEHCSKQLPGHSPIHLSQVTARGRAGGTCCGGTVVVPLDDFAGVLPQSTPHGDFIRAYVQTPLCS